MRACPNCGSSLRNAEVPPPTLEGPRRDVARVGSLAEAGYLGTLLEEVGISADSRLVESFNAATGEWVGVYQLSVPEEQVGLAARTLQDEASGEAQIAASGGELAENDPALSSVVNPWRMLSVLAVVVATGAIWNAGRGDAQRRPRPAEAGIPPVAPLAALGRMIGPDKSEFVARGRDGQPTRRLVYRQDADAWILSIDANHDGRYESHQRFAAGGVDQPGDGR